MIRKKIMTEADALRRLAALCARGEHCSGEMDDKMRRWGLTEEARQRVIDRLIADRYIDDERFTRFFVHDKIAYNRWGRRKIEQALWMKHIDSDVAAKVLDDVDDEEYLSVLRPLLKSKWRSIKAETSYERAMKLMKFAMGRGFSVDLIRKCIDEGLDTDDDDNDE